MRFGAVVALLIASGVYAAQPSANPEDLQAVVKALNAPTATEPPRLFQAEDGFFRFIGAPPGTYFLSPTGTKTTDPATNAESFLKTHAGAFAAPDANAALEITRIQAEQDRRYVRLKQTYGGLDVFGSGVMVQLDDQGGVVSILSDIMRSVTTTANVSLPLSPSITSGAAQQAAIAHIQAEVGGVNLTASPASLLVYDPGVIGTDGPTRLVWHTHVSNPQDPMLQMAVFVDAITGQVPLYWSLIHDAKNRMVYDAGNLFVFPGALARTEGADPTDIKDIDDAYDYLGDTYDFYMDHHGRDAFDGLGATLTATVRFGMYPDAFWFLDQATFSPGMATDDIVAHELTHGVTQNTSNLIYLFESGAINESFSDMWGEWVDLSNESGLDTDEVRWLMGEDSILGPIRSMKDPTLFGDPDRYYSPLWKNWPSYIDNGGVHTNSGVGNKLCYLLTDGDSFNGKTITGMGIERTAKLMYEVQSKLLTPGSDYLDLYFALSQASINLGLSFQERLNLRNATTAVEIAPIDPSAQLRNFRATPAHTAEGDPVIVLTWHAPDSAQRVTLVRATDRFPNTIPSPGAANDRTGRVVFEGNASSFVDGTGAPLVPGKEYFYSLFVDVQNGLPFAAYARATAADMAPDYLSELFMPGAGSRTDLSFSQLLFTPVGDPLAARDSGQADSYYNYSNYVTSIQRDVRALPVARRDGNGQAVNLPMGDDDFITYTLGSTGFPYFGKVYNRLVVSSNGYIAFQSVAPFSFNNFPSLEAHFDLPRISFLFADLAPNVAGNVWARSLTDRLVVTFERVPEWTFFSYQVQPGPNTVQVELFYSGHIRITYLELHVDEAVVGLSDGNGVPPDLDALLPGTPSTIGTTDLSAAAAPFTSSLMVWPPIPYQIVTEGAMVEFVARTVSPSGEVPRLRAVWDRPSPPPFADNLDGTGTFRWQTTSVDDGLHVLEIVASTGSETAYQTVSIVVVDANVPPQALNLKLHSGNPVEDPGLNRVVSANATLWIEYDYYHPDETRDAFAYGEGRSLIYWYCNGVVMNVFTNNREIPPSATRAGQEWNFTVTPETNFFVRGQTYYSPTVTIIDTPQITDVTPASGPKAGGTVVRVRGYNLRRPSKVRFGGFDVQSIRAISDTEIEVVTPVRAPATVDVEVDTPDGTARIPGAFTFMDSNQEIVKADINEDGKVDATDIQLVINAVLGIEKRYDADANRDGSVDAADIQVVVNSVLGG
jgi:Zn-dependent metalloprotease